MMPQPEEFPFPFAPYEIQVQFMSALYRALEDGKVGIFESPTGTGKSLSLICGALKWLSDFQDRQAKSGEEVMKGSCKGDQCRQVSHCQSKGESVDPDWVADVTQEIQKKKRAAEEQAKFERQRMLTARLQEVRRHREARAASAKKRKLNKEEEVNETSSSADEDLLPEDYQSDGESSQHPEETSFGIEEEEEEEEEEEGEEEHVTKIYYCSRTHSQLTQFVHEVKKSPYANSIKLVALGSRQSSCINEDVRALKSITKINERCLELQKARKDIAKDSARKGRVRSGGCPYHNIRGHRRLRDHALSEVFDIEEMVSIGRDLETCPYYGARYALPQSQLVVVPYNTILHKATREAVGIRLKDNVVIVDEAHNLMETVSSIHSLQLTASQISSSYRLLSKYHDRFRSRLKPKNLAYIKQLLLVLEALKSYLAVTEKAHSSDAAAQGSNYVRKHHQPGSFLERINDFLFNAKIDNLNLFKVKRYCEQSLIARKLNGFVERYQKTGQPSLVSDADQTESAADFFHVQGFLEALTNADRDGRVLVSRLVPAMQSSLKFLLLNPAVHFAEIAREARAVIIAGGTMQPVEEIKEVLLRASGVDEHRILEFSCGHVIAPDNLLAISLTHGPTHQELDFTYQCRDSHPLIDELGRVLLNLFTVVVGGVVVFFPSYEYEETVHARWVLTGQLSKLQGKKRIFREPRQSQLVDEILTSYARTVKLSLKLAETPIPSGSGPSGAALMSIVGGKMSEGINFADDLGRCVVVVGLPYANVTSPELKEKLAYLDKTVGPKAGRAYYENICMKAVNQSIGRAIRHRDDFACIVLADHRFARPSVLKKLPAWIQRRVNVHQRFGPAIGDLSKFFAHHRTK